MRRGGAFLVAIAAGLASLLLAVPAGAFSTAPGYVAQTYASGFPSLSGSRWGPIGIAFDQSDNLYVADTVDGNIYRFQPGGGVAGNATRLTTSPISGTIEGLVIAPSGAMYLARHSAGDIVQIDPGTGRILRTVASVQCPVGLAIDPASGDLFVSENLCGNTIWRVSGYANGPGTVTAYATAPAVDGMAFDQDGTLYAESASHILKIEGTRSATPGATTNLTTVSQADGIAFGSHAAGQPKSLVTNRNDGIVTRVDFGQTPPAKSNIFTGGSRGDFAAVDSAGCLFITQTDSIVRISGNGQRCVFEPTTGGTAPPPGVTITNLSPPPKACTRVHSLRLRLSQRGRVRLRSATVYVNGRRVRRLRGAAVTAPFRLRHLPSGPLRIDIVAVTTRGRKLYTSQFFSNCHKPPKTCVNTAHLTLRLHRKAGTRIVMAAVYFEGRRIRLVHGSNIRKVVLKHLPKGRFTLKLVLTNAQGKIVTTRRSFVGCWTA